MNKNLFKLIERYESLHDGDLKQVGLQPKMDPIGIWTEGWGHAIVGPDGKFVRGPENKDLAYKLSKIKTEEDAFKILEKDVQYTYLVIERKIKVDLTENQKAALSSFIYNTGGSPTLFSLINNKSPRIYDWWTTHYITAGGVRLRGLVNRRKSEAELFVNDKLILY